MGDTTIGEHLEVAERVAESFARSYPPVERDDIYGTLTVWLCENATRVNGLDPQVVSRALRDHALTFCRSERAARMHTTDQYHYRPEDIRDAMPAFFDYQDWDAYRVPEDAKSDEPADNLALLSDISRVWDTLREQYRDALAARYQTLAGPEGKVDWPAIAATLGVEEKAAKNAEYRAIRSLIRLLNDNLPEHDGPGARTAISNASAIARTTGFLSG